MMATPPSRAMELSCDVGNLEARENKGRAAVKTEDGVLAKRP